MSFNKENISKSICNLIQIDNYIKELSTKIKEIQKNIGISHQVLALKNSINDCCISVNKNIKINWITYLFMTN